jgi:predicted nuclease of predicted toxin-antitoxin system
MRILIDMNLTPRWVGYFVAAGHDCCHWSTIGPSSTPDSRICLYARENDFVLITNDLDFPQILAHTAEGKPSVIILRGEPLTPELRGTAVLRAIADYVGELESGCILIVDWSDRIRARLLPLR